LGVEAEQSSRIKVPSRRGDRGHDVKIWRERPLLSGSGHRSFSLMGA
jgi:hypothetical protein